MSLMYTNRIAMSCLPSKAAISHCVKDNPNVDVSLQEMDSHTHTQPHSPLYESKA